jgi:hypothetical protein
MQIVVRICILVLLAILQPSERAYARIGFKKDQSVTKIDFPPKIARWKSSSTGIPQGHLRPLGESYSHVANILAR